MNDSIVYNGVVTLIHRVNNKVVSKRCYNSGTINLFEAFIRAICGQSIDRFQPKKIDIGFMEEGEFVSKVKNGVDIPVVVTYKDAGTDGGNYESPFGQHSLKVPYCRVSVALFTDMMQNVQSLGSNENALTVVLKSSNDDILASVNVEGLVEALTAATSGVQLLLLWDLYVTNGGSNR
jgi:hypothetical protein